MTRVSPAVGAYPAARQINCGAATRISGAVLFGDPHLTKGLPREVRYREFNKLTFEPSFPFFIYAVLSNSKLLLGIYYRVGGGELYSVVNNASE